MIAPTSSCCRAEGRRRGQAGESSPRMSVPLFDTSTALAPLRDELRGAIARVLDSERYILGPEVEAFEREFAAYCGATQAWAWPTARRRSRSPCGRWASGRAMRSSCPRSPSTPRPRRSPRRRAPVFCDIDPDTYCVTPDTVKAALTPRTKAVIAVHLFGNVAPIAEIAALGVPVLEDAAQAAGSTWPRGARERSAPSRRSPSFPPRTWAASATAAWSRPPTRELAERVRRCASTVRTTRSPTSRLVTTRAWTSCRQRSCGCSSPTSMRGPWAQGGGATLRVRAGPVEGVALPAPVAQADPAWHLYVIAHPEHPGWRRR